jgi:hypothetical protein
MPYTNHVNAMLSMFMSCTKLGTPMAPQDFEFLSILGFLDLQTHTLNRMTRESYIWYTYCRGQSGVHWISGLPCSLMDLLSSVHIPGTESALLAWTVPSGTPAQQCLWKATRLAGILSVYRVQHLDRSFDPASWTKSLSLSPLALVNNILALIQQCLTFVPSESPQFKQTIIYPLAMAASRRAELSEPMMDFISRTIQHLGTLQYYWQYSGILRVTRDFWQSENETIEDTARRLDIEVCLL